jgi:hypothetical protein
MVRRSTRATRKARVLAGRAPLHRRRSMAPGSRLPVSRGRAGAELRAALRVLRRVARARLPPCRRRAPCGAATQSGAGRGRARGDYDALAKYALTILIVAKAISLHLSVCLSVCLSVFSQGH